MKHTYLALITIGLLAGLFIAGDLTKNDKRELLSELPKAETRSEVVYATAPEPTPSLTPVEQAIYTAFEEFGPQIQKQARDIAFCESTLNPKAVNTNTSGSKDRGLWQWNNKWHPKITDKMAFNPIVASRLAADYFRRTGGFGAWKYSVHCWRDQ